jgi:type II secretory pathway pseudopilin PulG
LIVVVIVVLAVLVIAAIVWARVSAARSENKSVETYEHALGVLGEVAKRTESTGFRIVPHEETGRPHVGRRIDPAGGEADAGPKGASLREQGLLASRRLPPAGEPKLRFSEPTRPARAAAPGGEDAEAETGALSAHAGAAGAVSHLASTHGAPGTRYRGAPYRSTFDRRRQVMARRVATGATAGVAVVAGVVAALYLSGGNGGHHPSSTTSTTLHHATGGSPTTTTTTTTTTLSTTLAPTTVSPVTFTAPSGDYTLAFQAAGGACWVGVEQNASGPWLFSETLDAGQSASYKGSGTLIVRLGAPVHISVTVNGLTAELPSGVTQAYSFDLTPAAT